MRSKLVLAAMAAVIVSGTLVVPTVSSAAALKNGYDPVSVRVTHADLDLSSAAGQARLERRVEAAITRMCSVGDLRDRLSADASRECRETARGNASRDVKLAIAKFSKARRA